MRGVYTITSFVFLLGSGVFLLSSSFTKWSGGINSNGSEIDTIFLEVESGEVEDPMLIKTDDYALGGEFVEVADGNKSSSNPPSSGKVTLQFTVSGGTYTIWGRTIAQTEGSDSFWFQVNDEDPYRWNGIPITPFWGWSPVHDADNDNQVVSWPLAAGTHDITIYYREPGTMIDALFITNTDEVPTKGNDQYPPNLVNLSSPPVPWKEAYNFTLPNFEFQHPMTVINSSELDMIRHYIEHQVEPQYTAYLRFMDEANDAQSFVPDAPATMHIMGGYEPNSNLNEVREHLWRNCHAAYTSGLAYQLTGESKYADKAIEVMMDWANANTSFTGGDRGLQLGSWFSQVLYAADLIHDYNGWTENQRTTFKSWWRNNVLLHPLDVSRGKDNNWKDAGLLGVFTAAVVLEDTLLLKEGLIQLKSYFYERTDQSVRNPGVDWKMLKNENGVYLPREVVRNNGSSGLTYTAYAMTSMVQCLDIAKYAGFDLWHDSTEQGADLTQLLETYYKWDILDQSFPWHPSPNKSAKRRNAYELANSNLELSDEIVTWVENNRPQVAREGDEYATLTKGDIHLSKLLSTISVENNQVYNPGETIPISIQIDDPYEVGIDEIQILFDGELQFTFQQSSVETFLTMPTEDTPTHEIEIAIIDGFGVARREKFIALNAAQAKVLELSYNNDFGLISIEPEQSFYAPGQEVKVTAIGKFPYYFKGWGGDNTSSTAELDLIMTNDVSLEAVFELRTDPRLNFNFQPRDNFRVPGYTSEVGDSYTLRDEIRSGWRIIEAINGIRRSSGAVWDPRKLSYVPMQRGSDPGSIWELEVANGNYNIEIGFGDFGNLDHTNTFRLEDVLVEDPDGRDGFDTYSFENFSIEDGNLTITPEGSNVKISYLKIAPFGFDLHHFLAVADGTGEGEYASGTQASITAQAATGTDLFEWAGDTTYVDDFSSNETFVLMPDRDVQVRPSYISTYALTVENGTGTGNYREGIVVNIEADMVEGREFMNWSGDTEFLADATLPSTTVQITNRAMNLKAEYEEVILSLSSFTDIFEIYPNPTTAEAIFKFSVDTPTEITIEIHDLSGKSITSRTNVFNPGIHQITFDQLVQGTNVLRIITGEQAVTHLIVKR